MDKCVYKPVPCAVAYTGLKSYFNTITSNGVVVPLQPLRSHLAVVLKLPGLKTTVFTGIPSNDSCNPGILTPQNFKPHYASKVPYLQWTILKMHIKGTNKTDHSISNTFVIPVFWVVTVFPTVVNEFFIL